MAEEEKKETCIWEQHEDSDVQYCGCGKNLFEFFEGGPKENHFKFCPYCGRPIEAVFIPYENK